MTDTAYGAAVRHIPPLIAIVNGLAPLLISLLIISPLWLQQSGLSLPWSAMDVALGTAFVVIFLLGTFLGSVSGRSWLWSGMRAVLLAAGTALLILVLNFPAT
jgi:VIT1/CCC1 family predicted Fe2+/Mn2+ transporter